MRQRVLVIGLMILASACGKGSDSIVGNPPPPPPLPPPPPPINGVGVTIQSSGYLPQVSSAEVGQTVAWTNVTLSETHTVTADNGTFDSGSIPPGKAYTLVFGMSGTYHYHCTIHPGMTGTIIVTP